MSEQPKSRAERRESERVNRKDYESVVKEIKAMLEERPDDVKQAVMNAILHLDLEKNDNSLISALMIKGSVDCEIRGDDTTARLLLYLSGAILNPILTRFTWNTIMMSRQVYEAPQPPHQPSGID